MDNPKTYWDTEDFSKPYQMGEQKHRVYILNKFKEFGVTSLLDVGCGTGPIYDLLINAEENRWDNIKRYKGVDYSQTMIDTCKRELPTGNFEMQDARHLTEPDGYWGCVLLMHCLDHLDDYKSAIAEAVRVSNKYICIVLWRGLSDRTENNLNSINKMGRDDDTSWEDTHLQEYSKDLLIEEFKKHNLEEIDFQEGELVNDGTFNTVWIWRKRN